MASIEEYQLGVGQVANEGLCAFNREERVVPAPKDECRRLPFPEERLEGRIQRHIGLIVAEQVDLRVIIFGAAKLGPVDRPVVRTEPLKLAVGNACCVLQLCSRFTEPAGQDCTILGRRGRPSKPVTDPNRRSAPPHKHCHSG